MSNTTIFVILKALEDCKIPFRLARDRPDTIRIDATLYGIRLEIECFDDCRVEFSTFRGDEDVGGGYHELLKVLAENL